MHLPWIPDPKQTLSLHCQPCPLATVFQRRTSSSGSSSFPEDSEFSACSSDTSVGFSNSDDSELSAGSSDMSVGSSNSLSSSSSGSSSESSESSIRSSESTSSSPC